MTSHPLSLSTTKDNSNFIMNHPKLLNNNNNNNNQNNNNFPAILNKADLQFEGNLEDVILNWSETEKNSRRRLVEFWRHHENNTIYCSFKPISPSQKEPNTCIISCIYWEEKEQYLVTSVDCILLLETLIAVRFTVEEKNRIRRNLEGFRPLTISKCKPETSEFFKLIMSFPNPKPRNIEKDVKVFPWKILPFALKKIISKYAAGYTPAMPITPSINSNYSNLSSGLTSPAPNFPMNFNPSQPMNNFPSRANMQRRFSQPINSMDMSQFMHPYKQMHRSRGLGGRMQNPIFNNELSSQFRIQEEEEDTFMENNNNNNNNTMNTITSIAPMNPFNYTMGNNNHSTIPMTNLDTNSISALSLESLSNNDNNLNNLNNQSHMINSTMTMNSLNNNNNSNLQQRFNTNFDHDFLIPQSASNNFIKQNQSFGPRRHSLADPYSLQRFQAMKFGIGPFAMNSTTQSSNSPFEFNNQLNENSLFQLNNVNNNNSNNNGQMSYMMNNNVNNFMENEIYNSNNNHQNNNNNNNNNTNFNNHFNNNFMNANNNNNTQPGTSFNFVEANFNYNNNNNTNSNHNNNDLLLSATSNLNTSNYLNEDFNYLQ